MVVEKGGGRVEGGGLCGGVWGKGVVVSGRVCQGGGGGQGGGGRAKRGARGSVDDADRAPSSAPPPIHFLPAFTPNDPASERRHTASTAWWGRGARAGRGGEEGGRAQRVPLPARQACPAVSPLCIHASTHASRRPCRDPTRKFGDRGERRVQGGGRGAGAGERARPLGQGAFGRAAWHPCDIGPSPSPPPITRSALLTLVSPSVGGSGLSEDGAPSTGATAAGRKGTRRENQDL